MKVKELIKELQQCDQDATVVAIAKQNQNLYSTISTVDNSDEYYYAETAIDSGHLYDEDDKTEMVEDNDYDEEIFTDVVILNLKYWE